MLFGLGSSEVSNATQGGHGQAVVIATFLAMRFEIVEARGEEAGGDHLIEYQFLIAL